MAGGLPSSQIRWKRRTEESQLTSWIVRLAFLKKYARKSRLDVVSKAVERMANEVVVKQDRNAWAVAFEGLG